MKKTIKLTESELMNIIEDTIKGINGKLLSESYGDSKDAYRSSYRMRDFNENLAQLMESIRSAEYYSRTIMNDQFGRRALKHANFYKSQERMERLYEFLQKAESLVLLVKQDVTGDYKQIADIKAKEPYGYPESEQGDYSDYPGWGE